MKKIKITDNYYENDFDSYEFLSEYKKVIPLLSEGFKYIYKDCDNFLICTQTEPIVYSKTGISFMSFAYCYYSTFLNKYIDFGDYYLLEDVVFLMDKYKEIYEI